MILKNNVIFAIFIAGLLASSGALFYYGTNLIYAQVGNVTQVPTNATVTEAVEEVRSGEQVANTTTGILATIAGYALSFVTFLGVIAKVGSRIPFLKDVVEYLSKNDKVTAWILKSVEAGDKYQPKVLSYVTAAFNLLKVVNPQAAEEIDRILQNIEGDLNDYKNNNMKYQNMPIMFDSKYQGKQLKDGNDLKGRAEELDKVKQGIKEQLEDNSSIQ